MLDQKVFGEKIRNHRKQLGFTQEDVAEKVGVSAQAVSKWEAGECLPDCFNLKSLCDIFSLSADVLLETQATGDIDVVAGKIEQIGTEFVWSNANTERYQKYLRQELGNDLWKMWKGLYFAGVGDRKKQTESKQQANLRIIGSYGTKIWDDDGIACVIQSALVKEHPVDLKSIPVMEALCVEEGQKLITSLLSDSPITKEEIITKSGIDIAKLNELILLFTENRIIEFVSDRVPKSGYMICGHCGIVAYMMIAAMHILSKTDYCVSQYITTHD